MPLSSTVTSEPKISAEEIFQAPVFVSSAVALSVLEVPEGSVIVTDIAAPASEVPERPEVASAEVTVRFGFRVSTA